MCASWNNLSKAHVQKLLVFVDLTVLLVLLATRPSDPSLSALELNFFRNLCLFHCQNGPAVLFFSSDSGACLLMWFSPLTVWELPHLSMADFSQSFCLAESRDPLFDVRKASMPCLQTLRVTCLPGPSVFKLAVKYIVHWLFTWWLILGDVAGWYPVSFCLCVYFSSTFNVFKGYIVFMVHWDKERIGSSFNERSLCAEMRIIFVVRYLSSFP
jgi:hypothetical protein